MQLHAKPPIRGDFLQKNRPFSATFRNEGVWEGLIKCSASPQRLSRVAMTALTAGLNDVDVRVQEFGNRRRNLANVDCLILHRFKRQGRALYQHGAKPHETWR